MTMKDITSLSIIVCLATLCINLTDAAWESYPLNTAYDPVLFRIGFYVSEDNTTVETQPTDNIGSTEIYGFGPDDDDDRVIFVDTIDPDMEQVIVDESTEIIDPINLSDPATDPDSTPSVSSSSGTVIEEEVDSEDLSLSEAGEESLTVSEPGDPDELVAPDSNDSDDLTTNESTPTMSEQKPVGDVSVTDLRTRPQTRIPDIPGRQINMATLSLPFTRRRDPNIGEAVQYVRVIWGYTAFETPLDVWLAFFSGGPRRHNRVECYFTMVPIEEMPELYHSGSPTSDDITSGRTTERFTLGDMKFSVKNATGVGCVSWVPREERKKGWWSRRRSV